MYRPDAASTLATPEIEDSWVAYAAVSLLAPCNTTGIAKDSCPAKCSRMSF